MGALNGSACGEVAVCNSLVSFVLRTPLRQEGNTLHLIAPVDPESVPPGFVLKPGGRFLSFEN